jgi:tetratricopeptide (TPR) repeat protein
MATKQAQQYKEAGNKAFKEGDHQKAIEYYTYATELDPKNPIFFTNRSTAYFKMKKWKKSLRDADKAIKCDPKWAKGYYRKGMVLMEMEQHKQALENLDKAAQLKPDNQSFTNAVATCKAHFRKGMSAAEILKLEANELFKTGKIDAALKKYGAGLDLCKNTPKDNLVKADLYANRAACHRQLYSSKEVVKDCTKALELNPRHVKAFIRRAQAQESLEKFKEALSDFQQACYLAPGTNVAVQGASRIRAALKREQKM